MKEVEGRVLAIPRAEDYLEWRGRRLFRCKGMLRSSKLTCIDGHPIGELPLVHEAHTFQCQHRVARPGSGHAICGALVWVRAYPAHGQQRRRYYAADVTFNEVKLIEQLGLDADEVLVYLGEGFHRGERTG